MDLLEEAPQIIRGWRDIRFHLFSSEVVGRLRPLTPAALAPGGEAIVEIRLVAPVAAARHDRFVIRRPSPATTLGGGEVLDPEWPRLRGARLAARARGARREATPARSSTGSPRPARRERPWSTSRAGWAARTRRCGTCSIRPRATVRCAWRKAPPAGHDRWIAAAVFERVARRAPAILDEFFRRDRLATGMPKAEVVRRLLPAPAAPLAEVYLGWLAERKILVVGRRPGRTCPGAARR